MIDGNIEVSEIGVERANPENAQEMLELQYQTALATAPFEKYGISIKDAEEKLRPTEEKIAAYAKEIENANEKDAFFVAVDGHKVVGRLRLTWRPEKSRYQFAEFFVRPGYMGQKIGSRLWDEARKTADPSKEIFLLCNVDNEKAIAIYEKWGFEKSGLFEEGAPFIEGGKNRIYTVMIKKPDLVE